MDALNGDIMWRFKIIPQNGSSWKWKQPTSLLTNVFYICAMKLVY